MSSCVFVGSLVVASLCAVAPIDARQRGVVTGLSVTPGTARTGVEIVATVTGVNPCGAVLVDWGDGTAVTHPIVQVPVTRTHVYTTAGKYRVSARGQGNCDGEAVGSVRIDAPPANPGRAQLRAFTVASPGAIHTPVDMTVDGEGVCTVALTFGDGNTQELSVELPHRFKHVYALPRAYNVTAAAMPPCEGGRHTARLEVRQTAAPARPERGIDRIVVSPSPAQTRSRVGIRIEGRGSCAVTIRFGDGSEESIEAALPARVYHTYARPGRYEVLAWAESPCSGDATASLQVRR